ncbi:Endonuclease/exonuclease/phosphatase [Syncephalis plumigaleata]|nr:Endonuclease/exonuclease/phosphatase [Syncephalis plumigaleata]
MDSSTATQISSNINDLVRKPALVDMQSSTAQMPVKLAHHAGRRRQRSKYNKADRVGEQGGMATLTDSYKSSPVNKAVLAKRANCQNEHNTTKRSLVVSSVMPGRSLHCNPRYSFNGPSAISAFSVMSWNILSQQYTARSRFNYVPSALLDWQHRSTRIIQMIVSSRAAIVALQEVDETFYHDVLEPQLREHNYLGIYERKRHPTLTDGCAIFYQQYRFSLIDVNVLHYQEAKINDIATSSSRTSRACPLTANQFSVQQRDLACRFNMHHNLALIATFHDRWTDRSTRIVNTHLLADPMYADAKLLQAALLCEQLERQMERDPMNRTPSTVLCGDWNSLPNSDVMTYLLAGRISRHAFGGSNFGRFTRNRMLRHRLHLTCAYATVGAKMNATVRTPQFTGEVDRILYTSSESLRVLAVLGDVNKRQQTFLPNASVPSDHMPLLTVFAYLSGRTTTTTILPAQSNVENVGKSTTLTASTPPLLNTAKACHLSTMLSYYPAHGLSSVYNGIQGNSNGVMASSSLSDNLAGQAEQLDTSLQMKPRATRRYRGTRGKRGGKRVARANAKNKEATTELGNQTSTVSTTT